MIKPSRKSVITFLLGAAASVVGAKFASSKMAHKIAVNSVAGGMRLKNEALRKVEIIREEAQDIYEEALLETETAEDGGTEERQEAEAAE
jgi:hypothetical protein